MRTSQSTADKVIASPTELETDGFIRIRGRILGSGRVGKRAGVIAIGVLVALLGTIVYGVTLNGAHRPTSFRQLSANPVPPAPTTPWWQNQSDAANAADTRHAAPASDAPDGLPAGVPDLSKVDDSTTTSTAAGTPHSAPNHDVRVAAYPISNLPSIPPLDEQQAKALGAQTGQINTQAQGPNANDERDVARHAAMTSPFLVNNKPQRASDSDEAQSTSLEPLGVAAATGSTQVPAARPVPAGSLQPTRTPAVSPFELNAGTIIPAALVTAIDSDLPGLLVAQVRQNTYDSTTGQYLLIPQGTKVIGTYDSRISYGQDRVLVAWRRLIYPDGSGVDLQNMAGADLAGRSGFDARVDNHAKKLFQGAILLSIIGAGAQLSQPVQPATNGSTPTVGQAIAGNFGGQIASTSTQVVQRQLDVPPNLRVPSGFEFNVVVDHDVVFPSPYGEP